MEGSPDVDQLKATIQLQFPDFKIDQIILVGSGDDCDAYQVNEEYIFKFPKHHGASDNLLNEASVLHKIQDKMPIPVPKVIFRGSPTEVFAMNYVGYSKLDGVPLTPGLLRGLSPGDQEQVAVDLAHFLSVLHNTEVSDIRSDLIIDTRGKFESDYSKIKGIVADQLTSPQWQKVERFYRNILDNEGYFLYKPSLIHNDFSSDHILYDVNRNKVCGIIDFADTAVSDPDNDFMFLFEEDEEYGQEFGLKVMNYYNHPNIDLFIQKFNLKETYWSFEKILYGKEYGYDDWYEEGIQEIKNLFTRSK